MLGRIAETLEIFRIVRRINHRRYGGRIRIGVGHALADLEVVRAPKGHAVQVVRKRNTVTHKFVLQMTEKSFHDFCFCRGRAVKNRIHNGRDFAVRGEAHVIKLHFGETHARGRLGDGRVVVVRLVKTAGVSFARQLHCVIRDLRCGRVQPEHAFLIAP